jgi:hypothetical protein
LNGAPNQQHLSTSTASSQQQQPFSGASSAHSQPPQPLFSNVAYVQPQSNLNGSANQQRLPSTVPSQKQEAFDWLNQLYSKDSATQPYLPLSTASSQQQQQKNATPQMQTNHVIVNPQGISRTSIAPSPYANMYKKAKPSVSNVASNSPWHRNSETNSSNVDKK